MLLGKLWQGFNSSTTFFYGVKTIPPKKTDKKIDTKQLVIRLSRFHKKIDVTIVGLTPLLMNRLNPEALKTKSRMKVEAYSTTTDAKNSVYMAEIDGKNQLYVPNYCLYSMLIGTARGYRIKRMSLSSLLAGTIRIEPEKISLGTDQYEVDERPVVIQRQRVLKGRAKIPAGWRIHFQIIYDAKHLPDGIPKTLYTVLEDAGVRMGLLDYRPQHRGWFGTFAVESFVPEGQEDLAVEPETD